MQLGLGLFAKKTWKNIVLCFWPGNITAVLKDLLGTLAYCII